MREEEGEKNQQKTKISMATTNTSHSRSHSLLLLQKLLNLRDGASPLTLLLDSLEQSAKPLLAEFIARAKASSARRRASCSYR